MLTLAACYAFGLCLMGALACAWTPANAQTRSGRVVWVSDGDTFTIRIGRTKEVVRIDGIDAPEQGQPGAQAARNCLRGLILYRTVTISGKKRDRYGRSVCAVYRDKRDIGYVMITQGHAWVFRRFLQELPKDRVALYTGSPQETEIYAR